jgi:hypothetical protein
MDGLGYIEQWKDMHLIVLRLINGSFQCDFQTLLEVESEVSLHVKFNRRLLTEIVLKVLKMV